MNLIINLNDINLNYIFFYEPVKNTILESSYFIRIIYSNEDIILNGIYLYINFEEKLENNLKIIEDLENNILSKFKSDKNFTKKVKENYIYLHNKNLLSENFTSKGMVLKISGIWETHTNIGLTFKFININ